MIEATVRLLNGKLVSIVDAYGRSKYIGFLRVVEYEGFLVNGIWHAYKSVTNVVISNETPIIAID